MVKQPRELGSRKIRVGLQTRSRANLFTVKVVKLRSRTRRATTLPDNRRPDGFERGALPDQRSFTLIRNRNGADSLNADLRCGLSGRLQLRVPNLTWRLLNPARSEENWTRRFVARWQPPRPPSSQTRARLDDVP